MAQKLGTVPLWFQPEAKWEYGPSVDVQAFLVERLSGQPYEQYVRQHVLDPLRMRETRYFVPESDRGRLAAMYNRSDAGVLTRAPDSTAFAFNTRHWPLTPGSYGLTSTLDDYMRFARMLLNGGELDGVRILKPETVRLMATSHLSDTITSRSWLPSKGQVGFGIDFAVRLRPPASRRGEQRRRRRVLLGRCREHAVLGGSGRSARGRAVRSAHAVRSRASAQELSRRRLWPDSALLTPDHACPGSGRRLVAAAFRLHNLDEKFISWLEHVTLDRVRIPVTAARRR